MPIAPPLKDLFGNQYQLPKLQEAIELWKGAFQQPSPGDTRLPFFPNVDLTSLAKALMASSNWISQPGLEMIQPMQIKTFHGSPYKFSKFENKAIGTGEGAQAFGYGHYLSESPEVAKSYVPKNAVFVDTKFKSVNLSEANDPIGRLAGAWIEETGNLEGALKKANEAFKRTNSNDAAETLTFLESLKKENAKIEIRPRGNIYETTIHKGKQPSEYRYMRWDEFVPEDIIKSVKNTIRTYYSEGNPLRQKLLDVLESKPSYIGEKSGITGHGLYRGIENVLGSDKQASAFLLRAGVQGNIYPTGSLSGMKGTGKYNYVVFNPKDITIEKVK